jgi:hypothetical protein
VDGAAPVLPASCPVHLACADAHGLSRSIRVLRSPLCKVRILRIYGVPSYTLARLAAALILESCIARDTQASCEDRSSLPQVFLPILLMQRVS